MSVGHTSRELVSTSPSGTISTEGNDGGSIPTMSSPGSVGRVSRQRQRRVLQHCDLSQVGAN